MRDLKPTIALCAIGIVAVLLAMSYSVFKPPAPASGPIQAVPLVLTTVLPASVMPPLTDTPISVAQTTPFTPTLERLPTSTPSVITAVIVPAESTVQFSVDELLNGKPNTVIGKTREVAGEIAVDPSEPAKSQVGTITVNARTLVTDNDFRNRAIQNRILTTAQFEFITFTPTGITSLPNRIEIGHPFSFMLSGNLTIRDVTRAVTFETTVTAASQTRLEGKARATVAYADYHLSIPQVRQVASIGDHVVIQIDFVAAAK
ncbi:MAG: hypothetical protein NVS2B7_29230 [Herpetosiphon sp.]